MSYIPNMAFLFSSVGPVEWVIFFAVVLVVVGPHRMPEVARKIGRTMEMFRRAADEFKEQLMSMDQEVKTSVSDTINETDVDGVSSDDDYANGYDPSDEYHEGDYDASSEYPGNEDIAAEWNDDADAEAAALESADISGENLSADDVNETGESTGAVVGTEEEQGPVVVDNSGSEEMK